MKRIKTVTGASAANVIGSSILRDVGSHDTQVRRDKRIRKWCPTCRAPVGSRCLNVALLPTRTCMRRYHRAR